MYQKLQDVIAIEVTCPSTVTKGDPVVMSDDNTVAAISGAGQVIVGTVCVHEADAVVCTIETRFRERRDDRVCGADATTVGPFVFDALGKVIAYASASHDPSAIAGVLLTGGDEDDVVETLEY